MKKITHLGVLLIICIGAAILFYTSRYQFKSISAHNFAILIDTADVNIVDVRTSKEHDQGHIPGTNYNIDVKGDSFVFQSLMLLNKDTPVALYCRSGNRSKTAAKLLAKKGYKVYELSSGFVDEYAYRDSVGLDLSFSHIDRRNSLEGFSYLAGVEHSATHALMDKLVLH